ncbi:hypothetical protein PFISCL1PPCAC_22877, partial [Pristionchus fissidentatus]
PSTSPPPTLERETYDMPQLIAQTVIAVPLTPFPIHLPISSPLYSPSIPQLKVPEGPIEKTRTPNSDKKLANWDP